MSFAALQYQTFGFGASRRPDRAAAPLLEWLGWAGGVGAPCQGGIPAEETGEGAGTISLQLALYAAQWALLVSDYGYQMLLTFYYRRTAIYIVLEDRTCCLAFAATNYCVAAVYICIRGHRVEIDRKSVV